MRGQRCESMCNTLLWEQPHWGRVWEERIAHLEGVLTRAGSRVAKKQRDDLRCLDWGGRQCEPVTPCRVPVSQFFISEGQPACPRGELQSAMYNYCFLFGSCVYLGQPQECGGSALALTCPAHKACQSQSGLHEARRQSLILAQTLHGIVGAYPVARGAKKHSTILYHIELTILWFLGCLGKNKNAWEPPCFHMPDSGFARVSVPKLLGSWRMTVWLM